MTNVSGAEPTTISESTYGPNNLRSRFLAVEKLSYLGALYGAYYLGGMIGSLMVAGDAYYSCKAGAGAAARMHQAIFASGIAPFSPSMQLFLMHHPELFDLSSPQRKTYGIRARAGAGL